MSDIIHVMDADTIADLKQFIATTISQQTSELREELHKTNRKIDDLSVFVATALDTSNDANQGLLNDHEKRICALERQAA